ncbi:hypothetical protein TBLA_0B00210 [Henningerozyma blattae CBS 6284]|uniref:Protein URE2 n=1 Tax=Henningerozyma blattae (strain ATCC 34711 / CBS 6284 / DSM 70876 / NBRC 10599 / NRRL Y-10934 / UCD 77-7) TaxID=1071380 RepID=I2GXL4_HENB6|nr:hypothetical protein TBLA_0B00210 [Tetrapisispora blattae CBS 6284]CCH58866.1 hypothetical protein TBLA_0B00210 [Tetrapisispora blattae CBS 6284]
MTSDMNGSGNSNGSGNGNSNGNPNISQLSNALHHINIRSNDINNNDIQNPNQNRNINNLNEQNSEYALNSINSNNIMSNNTNNKSNDTGYINTDGSSNGAPQSIIYNYNSNISNSNSNNDSNNPTNTTHSSNNNLNLNSNNNISDNMTQPNDNSNSNIHIANNTNNNNNLNQTSQMRNNNTNRQFLSGLSPIDNTRISSFFQDQPMEGYTLFSHRSAPNAFKVAIVLSELGLQYNTIFLDFNKGEHRAPEFVGVNPNARVPALIDHNLDNLGIWESGAILLHLVNKYFKETGDPLLWADNLADQSQINSWLFFQTSGHAPMIGQALHFEYFHSQKIPSAVERYTDEVRRVYGVVEMALSERREALVMDLDTENAAAYSSGTTPMSQSRFFDYPVWLVGDRISIADLAFVPWNNVVDRIGINIKAEFPEVYKWTKHMMRRPAVIKALRGE